jgi:2-aminomuconate deaminase
VPNPSFARPRGAYPLVKVAGGFAFVSGTSSRRPDNSFAGVEVDDRGTTNLDIGEQTRAVLENIERVLTTIGLDRADLVDATTFLVNMNDFGGYNREWALFFQGIEGPARTTVAAHQLPHPHLLIEVKATAMLRSGSEKLI